jgi:hypothetical protein
MARSSAEAGVMPGDPLPGWAGGPVPARGLGAGEGADRDQALKRTRCCRTDMVQFRTAERGDGTGGRAGGVV